MTLQSKSRPGTLVVLSSLCSLCLCGESSAALDPERTTPYHLKVVLHLGDSRLLTDVFRENIERGLQDYLQGAFGNLARVEVVRTHPRLADVLDKGLQRALDNWKDQSGTKAHFVLIDYVNGYYEIQARQHDGLTGLASPIVRTDRTRDRAFVARAAAFLVEKDFGFIGTFDAWPRPPGGKLPEPPLPVTLQLKGGALNVPLSRWVQRGEVFQVVRMPDPAGNRPPELLQGDLVRVLVAPGDEGVCQCQLFWRYEPPKNDLAGYRCLKIATIKAPVRLRVTQKAAGGGPATVPSGVRVEVRRNQETRALPGFLDAFGAFDSGKLGDEGLFDHLALVNLISGSIRRSIPVPLIDEQPVAILLDAAGVDEEGGLLNIRRENWRKDVAGSYAVQTSFFKRLQAGAADSKQRAETLAQAKTALRRSRADHARLTAEREGLLKAPGGLEALALEDKMLDGLRKGETVLDDFIVRQGEILKVENDPERRALLAKVQQARLLEEEGDYDAAIDLYEKVAKDAIKIGGVQDRLDNLNRRWTIKTEAQREAREFIYSVFPKLETARLEAGVAKASEHVTACKGSGDDLTPRRLLLAIQAHAARLTKELGELNEVNVDDESKIRTIKKVADDLRKLTEEVGNLFPELAPRK